MTKTLQTLFILLQLLSVAASADPARSAKDPGEATGAPPKALIKAVQNSVLLLPGASVNPDARSCLTPPVGKLGESIAAPPAIVAPVAQRKATSDLDCADGISFGPEGNATMDYHGKSVKGLVYEKGMKYIPHEDTINLAILTNQFDRVNSMGGTPVEHIGHVEEISSLSDMLSKDLHFGLENNASMDKARKIMEARMRESKAEELGQAEVSKLPHADKPNATASRRIMAIQAEKVRVAERIQADPAIARMVGKKFVSGKISDFGGKGDSGVGSDEKAANTNIRLRDMDNKNARYCTMRFDYAAISDEAWRDEEFIVYNPKTGLSTRCKRLDWGPNVSTGRLIDASKAVLDDIGADTDTTVFVAFARKGC